MSTPETAYQWLLERGVLPAVARQLVQDRALFEYAAEAIG